MVRCEVIPMLQKTSISAALHQKQEITTKSPSVTARGVPPTAYPVRGVFCLGGYPLSWPGQYPLFRPRGYPLSWPPWPGGTPKKNLGPNVGVPPIIDLGSEAGKGTWDQRLGYSPPPPVDRQTARCP